MSRSDNSGVRFYFNGKTVTNRHLEFSKSLDKWWKDPATVDKFQRITEARFERLADRIKNAAQNDWAMLPEVMVRAAIETGEANGGLTASVLASGSTARNFINPLIISSRLKWAPLKKETLRRKRNSAGRGKFFYGKTGRLQSGLRQWTGTASGASPAQIRSEFNSNATLDQSNRSKIRLGSGTIYFPNAGLVGNDTTPWSSAAGPKLGRGRYEARAGIAANSLNMYKLINTGPTSSSGKGGTDKRAYRPLIFPVVAFFTQVRYPALAKKIIRQALYR